jgi:hypothetical protein
MRTSAVRYLPYAGKPASWHNTGGAPTRRPGHTGRWPLVGRLLPWGGPPLYLTPIATRPQPILGSPESASATFSAGYS